MTTRRYADIVSGDDLRHGSGAWERATNAHQRKLTRAFDRWGIGLRKAIEALVARGATDSEIMMMVDLALPELEATMARICRGGVTGAANLSLKSGGPLLPSVTSEIIRKQLESDTLVKGSLIPGIRSKLGDLASRGGMRDSKALRTGVMGIRSMPASYAGGYWAMIFEVQRHLGKDKEQTRQHEGLSPEPILWVLEPGADHCMDAGGTYGCTTLAGEYESWDHLPTVPAGQTTCRGNCRCHLKVFRNGEWTRGVY